MEGTEPDHVVAAAVQMTPDGIARVHAPIDIDSVHDQTVDADVAVIDSGIADHSDLQVVGGVDCTGGWWSASCQEGSYDDGSGHGTHVAGTIGAINNDSNVVGVAPGVRLHAVKVLGSNGSGYMSWIVAGIDWVTKNADDIEVANMSLGCQCSSAAMDDAITASVDAGITYVAAAGNDAMDATTFSPANHPDVITVAAARKDSEALASFSNWGPAVELVAPGSGVVSTSGTGESPP